MVAPQQEHQHHQQPKRKRFPIVRLVIAIIVSLLFAVGATVAILKNLGSLSTNLFIICSILSALFALFQWFFPFSSREADIFGSTQVTTSSGLREVSPPSASITSPQREQVVNVKAKWGEVPNVQVFYGRQKELEELERWITHDRCQMIVVLGMGGIGKTTLAARLAETIQNKFEYIFWRSLQHAPSVQSILKECNQLLSEQQRADLPDDVNELISVLIEYLREHRCLIVLDNFESILQAGTTAGHYRAGFEGYGKLLQCIGEVKHKSCLVLTSREKPREIPRLEGKSLPVRSIQLTGIKQEEAREILKDENLIGSDETWEKFIKLCFGNPLILKLNAEPIRELFMSNIASFLDESEAVVGDIYGLLDQHFGRLSELEQSIIYWLAIEREAVSLDDFREDIVPSKSGEERLEALKSLRRRSMVETSGTARFTLQPVIMEYATDRFVGLVYDDLISEPERLELLASHALIKAQAKDYIRAIQIQNILAPITKRLLANLEKVGSERKLRKILSILQETTPEKPGYAAGNILNLLIHLNTDLRGYDFSHLVVWQAYLQGVSLCEVNFAHAVLSKSVFTDSFSSIFAVALSPQGDRLAAGTASGEVRLWDTASAKPMHTFQGHTEWVRSVAFSPDGDTIVSGSEDQTIRLWNVSSGKCIKTLQGHWSRVYSVAFSPDGDTIVSGSADQTIRLWDASSGECLKTLQEYKTASRVYSVAFSPDGTTIASGSEDKIVRLWDAHTGMLLKTFQGHTNRVRSVAFSPDGNIVVSGSEDQTVCLWHVHTGMLLKTLQKHTDRVWSVAFSPDGKTIASGSDDQTIRLWDANNGECFKLLQRDGSRVYSVVFSSDGKTIASGSDGQSIRLWDTNSGQCLKTLQGHGSRVYSVTFSPDGNTIVSGSEDKIVRLWDVSTAECTRTLQGHTHWVWSVSFSSNGTVLASGGEDWTVRLWNAYTGESLRTLQGHSYRVYSVTFSPDDRLVASSSGDQTVKLWDAITGDCLKTLQGHTNRVRSVAFSPDGNMIASSSDDQTVKLWEVNTGECLKTLQGHTNRVRSVAFSPDGNMIASSSDDQTIRLWDASSGECFKTLCEHSSTVYSVAFSPDGKTVASSSDDQTVCLWEASTGTCLKTLVGHGSTVYSVAFHPEGNMIASGSHDGTIKLWNTQTGECKKTLWSDRPYERMNIFDVKGLTPGQKDMLRALGAVEEKL